VPKDGKSQNVMNSVDRALSLLQFFSVEQPEIGLSDLSRASGYDKTTTLRCLNALERNGFVEQHPDSKRYRLGIATLHLSRVREQSFPLQTLIQPVLDRIAAEVGETAHASLITHDQLVTVAVAEPARGARVFVDPSIPLPFHATASGIVVLAHMTPEARADLRLSSGFALFTAATPTSEDAVQAKIATAHAEGIARAESTFEDDVIGTAVPIFGWRGKVIGAVALAAVASRYDADLGQRIDDTLRACSTEISNQLGR
jgi:DNA-binding IclR family transcriptional regulator